MNKEDLIKNNNKEQLAEQLVALQNSDVAVVTAERDNALADLGRLQTQLDAANNQLSTLVDLPAKVAELEAENEKLKSPAASNDVTELRAVIDQLTTELRARDLAKGSLTVEVPGYGFKKIKLKGAIIHKGKRFTAEDLQANPGVCAELMKIGSSVIAELEPSETEQPA